jgi:hypothetical protein
LEALLNCRGVTPLDLVLRPLAAIVLVLVNESMLSFCKQQRSSSLVGRVIYVAVAGVQAVQLVEALVPAADTLRTTIMA